MHLQLSNELNELLNYAKEEAIRLGSYTLETDHIILGMVRQGENSAIVVLDKLGINMVELKRGIEVEIKKKEMIPLENANRIILSKASENALKVMYLEARATSRQYQPDAAHLLLAILRGQENCVAIRLLADGGISYDSVRECVERTFKGNEQKSPKFVDNSGGNRDAYSKSDNSSSMNSISEHKDNEREEKPAAKVKSGSTPVLDSFGFDLTKAAREERLDPVVGREKEIERLAQILGRRKKNNPVLIGEPGVGKSAIAEGLAIRIAQKKVSANLMNKRIVSLDIGSIVAGTKYRGQFEERMKAILNEIGKNPNIILFIDEMHTLVGAGGAAGSLDAANMLKPALARGELQCIGATTLDEFRQFIEKDGALERRFQKIMVEPTSFDESITILEQIKEHYQKHHNVIYTPEAIRACVGLSERYISDRCLPDKAIDILDESGSRVHIRNLKAPKQIVEAESALASIREAKQKSAAEMDFKKAAIYRDLEREKAAELERLREKWDKKRSKNPDIVDKEDIAEVVSMATGIPVNRIAESEGNKLFNMGNTLRERIIGQEEAIERVTRAIQRSRAGLKDPNKPIGTFLFLGPTGVGKTQLAKMLAEFMFDTQDALIRIDMSEYMEKHAVSRLIGAPPGYVGYDEGGQLSERVRRKPYSVVLLDEIEKAHPDIYNILLQVLDEGKLTDSNGRRIDFRNTLLILTSNIGTKELKEFGKGLGFANSSKRDSQSGKREIVEKAIQKTFTPEFINRIDEQILFNSLTKENLEKIIEIELKHLYTRVAQAGFSLKLTAGAKKFVAEAGYDPQYGARPLKRAIQRYIEDPVAEAIISGKIKPGATITLGLSKDKNTTAITRLK